MTTIAREIIINETKEKVWDAVAKLEIYAMVVEEFLHHMLLQNNKKELGQHDIAILQ